MSTVFTNYSEYANASLSVTNSSELNAAINQLAGASGGTINVDPNGGPYDLQVSGIGSPNAPILVQSAGGGMPVFHSVTIQNSEFIAFDGIDMDTSGISGRSYWEDDLRIENSNDIEIYNSMFTGHAQGYLSEGSATEAPTGVKGHSAAYIVDSQNITLSGNTFSNHFNTFRAEDIQNLVFDDNEITAFQGDGFHAGGLQDAQITNNHLHTPLGSTQTITHSDFIHIRAYQADLRNDGIEISNNLIDSASGWGAQGIHIRNTQFGTGNQWDGYLQNISIHDNVIHTSLPRGIGVNDIQGLEVYNNTVLWNSSSQIETTPDSTPISWDARILVYNSPGANVSDNIASYIRTDGVLNPNGGYMINYNDPNSANYVGNHFVNVDGSGDPNSYNLNLQANSSLYGNTGAAMSSGDVASNSASAVGNTSDPTESQNPTTANPSDAVVSVSNTEESEIASVEASVGNGEIPNILNADLLAPSEFGPIESQEEPLKQSNDAAAEVSGVAQWSLAEQMVFATHDPGVSFEDSLTDWLSGASQALEEGDVVRTGESGPDQILGGSGSDIINGKGASDLLVGGAGRDRLVGEKGEDTLFGGDGKDLLNAGRGDDFLFGGDGKDKLIGAEGRDWLSGGLGNDLLKGGAGNDMLVGGSGSDTIVGGEDNDVLIGGDGADRFVFLDGFGQDTILDFNSSESQEKIDMRGVSEIEDWFDVSTRTQEYNDGLLVSLESGDTLYLEGLAIEELYADDFWF